MKNAVRFLLALLLVFSCHSEEQKQFKLFTLLSSSVTGVDFINQLTENEQFNMIEYLYFNNGAGVAAGDINNDGLIDLYFTSNQKPNKLYLNKGGLRFEDITESAGVAGTGTWKTGVTMADVNGDGFMDIYVCQVGNYKSFQGRNQLFVNQGNLTFREESRDYGLDFRGFSTQAAFFDYDTDGDLDMYLLNHSVHSSRNYGDTSLRRDHDEFAGDRLFRNDSADGRRVFHDVTRQAGIYSSRIGYGLGINICDMNNDGLPDIFISNDFHENDYLYVNNGNSTFTERMTEYLGHTSRSSMGNDVGDFNNDGLMDIMVLDMMPDEEKIRKQSGGEDDYELFKIKLKYGYYYQFVRNTLQLNLGGGLFSEIGLLSGVSSTDWSWSPLFCDMDNDGWKDLFITNGIYRRANDLDYIQFLTGGNRFAPTIHNKELPDKDLYEKMPLYPHVNYIFKNNGDLTFSSMAKEWGLDYSTFSNGSAYADLDNDGDLDLIANNINETAYICRNNSEKNQVNHFISVELHGSSLNTRGTGSRVEIYHQGQKQVAQQFNTRGFMSASSDVLHFGLGSAASIDSLNITWPGGAQQQLKIIPADKKIILEIGNAVKPSMELGSIIERKKMFSEAGIPGLHFKHREDNYVDFDREKLIPHSLTSEGPALAVGDVNGDGLEDVFAGGAKGQASVLFLQKKNGSFSQSDFPDMLIDRYADAVDAVFFDADGDKDPDLYVVRGGNELPAGNALLRDGLFINDGIGGFKRCNAGSLPFVSHTGSCVRPADFDSDGDLDIFVGSRSVPGSYGLSPVQFLLENDGKGNFRDVTDRNTGIKNAGMVTDACWMDYDGDGDPDLVLAGEWMKLSIFRNDKGIFKETTDAAGLNETSGWWNCIQSSDVDRDGDLDLIAGNLGLNSMLKASASEPVEMYLNDFDNNGSLDQVITCYQDGISYPVASLDELAGQITGFEKKFPTYADFGGKTIQDIFDKKTIEKCIVKKAVLFESCIFLNNGAGVFSAQKLPVEVQFSTVRAIEPRDINRDGKMDLLLAGNNYAVRPSYGRYDASYGWCLLGSAASEYHTMMPIESGFVVKGAARRICPVKVHNIQYLIVAVNNGELKIFQIFQ